MCRFSPGVLLRRARLTAPVSASSLSIYNHSHPQSTIKKTAEARTQTSEVFMSLSIGRRVPGHTPLASGEWVARQAPPRTPTVKTDAPLIFPTIGTERYTLRTDV